MIDDDLFFEKIADAMPESCDAPSKLKARIYSHLVQAQAQEGALASLPDCKSSGHELCVFEELVAMAPIGEDMKSANPCRVCHARILGEHVENAPIWWPGCPYVRFQNR